MSLCPSLGARIGVGASEAKGVGADNTPSLHQGPGDAPQVAEGPIGVQLGQRGHKALAGLQGRETGVRWVGGSRAPR